MESFIICNVVFAILGNEMVYEYCSSVKQMAFMLFGTCLNSVNSKFHFCKCPPPPCFTLFSWWLDVNCISLSPPHPTHPPKMEERKCCPCTRFSSTYYGAAKPWFLKRRLPICFSGKNLSGRNMPKNAKAWSSPILERYVLVLTHSETESPSLNISWKQYQNILKV